MGGGGLSTSPKLPMITELQELLRYTPYFYMMETQMTTWVLNRNCRILRLRYLSPILRICATLATTASSIQMEMTQVTLIYATCYSTMK